MCLNKRKTYKEKMEESCCVCDDEKLPMIRIDGDDARSIGLCHGKKLRDRVRRTWKWYKTLFESIGANTKLLKKQAAHFQNVIREFDERYADEIEGIAEGCGLEPYAIYCLNARTEISLQLLQSSSDVPSECTSAFSPKTCVLAQNWDWDETLENLAVISEIHTKSKRHAILTMHEPGMLAKTGFNSKGIGVCLNALHIPKDWKNGDLNGVPVHVLLRAILDRTSYDDVRTLLLKRAKIGTSAHVLLGCKDGRYDMIEFAGNVVDFIRATKNEMVLHTNHYLGCKSLAYHSRCGFPGDVSADSSSTTARFCRGKKLIGEKMKHVANVHAMKSLLRDDVGKFPICREMIKSTSKSGGLASALGRIGTVCCVVMDLKSLTMHVTRGSPIRNPYVSHTFSGSGP